MNFSKWTIGQKIDYDLCQNFICKSTKWSAGKFDQHVYNLLKTQGLVYSPENILLCAKEIYRNRENFF